MIPGRGGSPRSPATAKVQALLESNGYNVSSVVPEQGKSGERKGEANTRRREKGKRKNRAGPFYLLCVPTVAWALAMSEKAMRSGGGDGLRPFFETMF